MIKIGDIEFDLVWWVYDGLMWQSDFYKWGFGALYDALVFNELADDILR